MRLKHRYITGFDGIRTLAVLGVIFYHLFPNIIKGGYLGVPVFFVISGYLIVDILRQEYEEKQTIHLKDFYYRRMKRLYPALIALLIAASTYITLFQRQLLNNLRGVFFSSLLYINNYWQIEHRLSYFDRFHNENPFTHLWSLSVEGQNYLILPLILIVLYRLTKKRQWIAGFFLGGSVLSAIWMAVQYRPGMDPTAIYDGTFSRLFSIWLGAALAIVWPSNKFKETISLQAKKILDFSGLAALIFILLSFFFLGAQSSFLYYGGMFLISVLSTILVASVAHPGANLNRWLSNPVFDYIGKRSYGIYLYQFPIMIFYESAVKKITNHLWLHTIIELILILAVSECSYRFIEVPLRKFDYTQTKAKIRKWLQPPIFSMSKPWLIPVGVVCIIGLFGILTAPSNTKTAEQQAFEQQLLENKKKADATKSNSSNTIQNTSSADTLEGKYQLTTKQIETAKELSVTAIGDSVMLGSVEELKEVFPKIVVDADVGRQLYNGTEIIQKLIDQNLLADCVILALGTNGVYSEENFDQMMQLIGKKRQVYLVNTYVPTQRWQDDVNRFLAKKAKEYSNITLINWNQLAKKHEDWFETDNVHLKSDGQIGYTSLLAKSVLKG
ncbi:MAG TPA: acetyltransferase [Enterococcus columbae]|nr:acetyltransferase [Enterococcus columbae]